MNDFIIITDPIQRTVIYYPEMFRPVKEWNYPLLFIFVTKDFHPDEIRFLSTLLTRDEVAKSKKFRFRNDQDSYLIVHGMLRLILGNFLGIQPSAVEVLYNSFGKPFTLAGEGQIFFNLSHSSGVSALAFSKGSEIGVDVEKINPDFDFRPIAQQFFSENENNYIQNGHNNQPERFFELWTRKEAFLKAIGIGITEHLNVEVSARRNLFRLNGESNGMTFKSTQFMLNTLTFQQKYIITLAVDPAFGRIDAFIPGKKGNVFLRAGNTYSVSGSM